MSMIAGLFTILALGGQDPQPPGDSPITFQVRFVEMQGLGWRGQLHERLTPVARQGGAMIWTAPGDLMPALVDRSVRQLGAPKVTAFPGAPVSLRTGTQRHYVAGLKRCADGPANHAKAVAYQPEIDEVDDVVAVSVCGRWLDQGLLTEVDIDETRLVSVASYTIGEEVQGDPDRGAEPARLNAQIQVPEVASGGVSGEWLIPRDGLLIVSLGVHTSSDKDGKAVPSERLALIEAAAVAPDSAADRTARVDRDHPPLPIAMSSLAATPARAVVFPSPAPVIPPAPPIPAPPAPVGEAAGAFPAPAPPSRTLPTPINHKGEVVDLPPLPEDEPAEEDPSAEPRPAPQSRVKAPSAPSLPKTDVAPPPPDTDAREPLARGSGDVDVANLGRLQFGSGPHVFGADLTGTKVACENGVATCPACRPADTKAESESSCCDREGLAHRVASALENYARSGECASGRIRVFDAKARTSKGETGRLAIYVEADELGRKMLLGGFGQANKDVGSKPADCCADGAAGACPLSKAVAAPGGDAKTRDDAAQKTSAPGPAKPANGSVEVKMCPQAASEATRACPEAESPTPKCDVEASNQEGREVWRLTIQDALKIALETPVAVRIVAVGSGAIPSPIVMGPHVVKAITLEGAGDQPERVRSIERAFNRLAQAQARCWAVETAVDLCEEGLRREKAKSEIGNGSIINIAEAQEQVERLRLLLAEARSEITNAEGQLRCLVGVSPANTARIVAFASEPPAKLEADWSTFVTGLARQSPGLGACQAVKVVPSNGVAMTMTIRSTPSVQDDCSVRGDRPVVAARHQVMHQLARLFVEAHAGYEAYQEAQKLKAAAVKRLEVQKTLYEQGAVTIDRYFDAVSRWANSVALEADYRAKYHLAMAGIERTKSSLTAPASGGNPTPMPSSTPKRDEATAPASFDAAGAKAPTKRLSFGITPVPVSPVFSSKPLRIRLPIGSFFVVEVTRIGDKTFPIGAFW